MDSGAESDFAVASKGKFSSKVKYSTLCYHAQQTAEKSIKAVLIYSNKKFPKTHDIEYLLTLAVKHKIGIPDFVFKAKSLTNYATITRYADDQEEIESGEYKQAVKIADKTLRWAKSIIEKKNGKLF